MVAESFLPGINGVTNSVLRVLEHLERRGHQALVVAADPGPDEFAGAHVERVRAVPLPCYRSFPVALPTRRVEGALRAFDPDVVHLASPAALGAVGAVAATKLGYVQAGLERVLVIPGAHDEQVDTPSGLRVSLRSPRLPGRGNYRALTDLERVRACLGALAPDRLEVSDKLTLSSLGAWGTREGIPTVLLSHERIDAILAPRVPRGFPFRGIAKRWNRRLARSFDTIVCTSSFAERELTSIGATNVRRVPLGVDLQLFHPDARGAVPIDGVTGVRLVCVGRLSREKRPEIAVEALRLLRSGVSAQLWMIGDGPMRERLERRAQGYRSRSPATSASVSASQR